MPLVMGLAPKPLEMLGLLRRVPEGSPARSASVLRFVGGSGTVKCQRWEARHSFPYGASRTAADLVLARDNAARRSHRAAAWSVVAIVHRAGILVALSRFLQGARSMEGGQATGRLQTRGSRVLERFHRRGVRMEWMACVRPECRCVVPMAQSWSNNQHAIRAQ